MPPGRVVLLHRPGQPQGSLLDQVQQVEALALVALGEIDDQAQIGRDHLLLGPFPQPDRPPLHIAEITGRAIATSLGTTL